MGEQKNIKVVVRVRPYNRRELEQSQRCIVKVMDKTTLLFDPDEEDDEFFFQGMKQNYRDVTKRIHKKMAMEYDRVYDTETTNDQLFEECTAPLIDSVLNGYNCSVFVYGATGAGKTFTMLGSDNIRGITFLTMKDLFAKINTQSDMRKFDVGVSYVEVYNEQVMNLLTKTGPMKLQEDANGVVISGLVLKPIHSADELLQMLAQGNNNRTQHPTDANAESSRSHAIFQVHIRMTEKKTGTKRMVKLSMIDLAGSERAASTKGIGVRFKEGASINKSLLALGNCINKLADGLKHIPYRDSNLTRILKDSLGGNCQTLMVANVSMSSLTYEDTYNTLKYASRAKKIRTTLRQNVLKSNMPKEFYVKKVQELMETNKNLESKVSQQQIDTVSCGSRGYDGNELKIWFDKIDAVYCIIVRTQEYVYGMNSKEKIFLFRTKLKEDAEVCRRILTIDQYHKDTFADFAASVTRFGKQLENQREDLVRWRKKLQEAHKDLEKLRKEIRESKCFEVLQAYVKGKDLEIQYSKQKIRLDHISRINGHYLVESDKMRKSFIAACEILRNTVENLTNDYNLKAELESNIEKVRAIVCDYEANLLDEVTKDINDDIDIQMEQDIETLTNGKRVNSNYGEDDDKDIKKRMHIKRLCSGTDSDWGVDMLADTDSDSDCLAINSTFKKPKTITFADQSNRITNTNETLVLSTDSDCNTSFELCTPSTSSLTRLNAANKNNIVSNILSENMVRVQSSNKCQQLKNVLLKSNMSRHGILKTVSVGRKENKKFSPNRIRKSPRSVVSRALSSTANLVRKVPTRAINGGSEPAVRINRAASFRVKK